MRALKSPHLVKGRREIISDSPGTTLNREVAINNYPYAGNQRLIQVAFRYNTSLLIAPPGAGHRGRGFTYISGRIY
jgi:hypothetical protein